MNGIKRFYQSFGFIIYFMFMAVLISALFGAKFLTKFLLLVLASQLIFNADEFTKLFSKTPTLINTSTNSKQTNTGTIYITGTNTFGDVSNGYIQTNTTNSSSSSSNIAIPRLSNGQVTYDLPKMAGSIVDKSKTVTVPDSYNKVASALGISTDPSAGIPNLSAKDKEKLTSIGEPFSLDKWWNNLKESTAHLVVKNNKLQ